ncbi:MAG: peptidase domain-containing ABC transporter [Legionellales bacterium]|nr:peptidase domain-containing ABC transporter [Legionellales bacterium]
MSFHDAVLRFSKTTQLPIILQDERAECGHACVLMLSHYWGHQLDLYELRRVRSTSSLGVTLKDINQLLQDLGFMTRALRVPLEEMHLIKTPAILHWNMNHFVVLKQVKKNHVVIHDPAVGVRRCGFEECSTSFTGIVLEVEKSSDFKAIQGQQKLTLFDLVKSIHGINKYFVMLLLLSFSIEVFSLLYPLFMQYVTDDVLGYSEQSNLMVIAVGFAILCVLQVFTEFIRGNMVVYVTNHLTDQFSSNVMRHLLKLPLAFFEKRHKGDLQSKFQSIDQIQKKISTDFMNTVLDGFMICINLSVMLIYSTVLTALVASGLLIYFCMRYLSYHSLQSQTETSIQQHANAMTVFLETLQGILPIKSFLKEGIRFHSWRNAYIGALNADIRVSKMNVIYQLANQLLFHFEHILVVCVAASLVLANRFSVGMLIAFLSYRLLLVNKASSLIQSMVDYKLLSIQLRRLSDILFQQPEEISPGSGLLVSEVKGSLCLENLSFGYDSGAPQILNNICFDIKAGEKVAIVGRSGCGKSTLLKVMMGLLKATSGEILIDNRSIHDFGLKNYRDLVASVMQDDALLSGSIMDNISFFDELRDMELTYQVARYANIHDEICQLPMGYESLVGDMGSSLSGGQKQRILLARALYRQPKILFLDEATSHLDVVNEKKINLALKTLEMTQIVIAHRKETIEMADRVIDLDALIKDRERNNLGSGAKQPPVFLQR